MDINIVPEDVVISGIGGYFPKAKNIEEFRKAVFENTPLVEPKWPEGERNCCNLIGCIDSDHFDNSYFGIHRQQCLYMDPMHRLALERTFEALVDAGLNPHEIKGKRIGVFMGSTIGENDNLFMESVVSGFGVTGHSRAMMPNRISYWLNLKGPSVAYDCNWVSGTEVLRMAYVAIKTGQCDSVIVGTANITTHSEFQWLYTDMGLLSSDGSTRAFDANATGYARSEGVVVLYIQRASEARRHYASIIHIATRFDGNREGDLLTVDSGNMVEFLEEFYEKSPVKPEQIEFVETYGCALKNVDEPELNALEKIFCKNRKAPLMIGSVKTITGHSEASASLFSIVQVIIAMEAGIIPATLQFQTPNPNIRALNNGNMEVVTDNRKWSAEYAAVNSIGIDSYYAHVVLKSNPKKKTPIEVNIPTLLVASTRTEDGITAILETLKNKPQDPEFYKLVQDVFSRPIQGHLHRGYMLFGEEGPKQETSYHQGNKRPIWFVYAGMGSQWCGMASDLMNIEVFAKSIKKSHDLLATKGIDLLNIITTSDKTIFDNILHCFVGIAAIQIALTDVLRALGIEPDAIIGHSVGELGCAYADGCMTAEQMILSSYSRGRASLEATLIPGMMAAIGLGYNQIKTRLPPTIEVACHNGSESCTISGPTQDMEVFVKQLQDEGVFARLVNVANIAYHSRYIKPAAPLLLKYLKDVLPQPMPRSSKWISTSNQESDWDTDLAKHSSAEYHTNNLLSSVLFEEGSKHIPSDAIIIEIAPHGLLQAILKRSVKDATNVPLTQRGAKSGVEFLLQSLGKLYLAGMDMQISNIYPKIEYPVSRNTPGLGDLVHWNHADIWTKGEDTSKSGYGIKDELISLNNEEFREFVGNHLNDNVVLPISYYLESLFQCTDKMTGERTEVIFENLHFRKHLVIPRAGFVAFNAMVQSGSGEFEIYSDDDLVLTGKIIYPLSGDEFVLEKAEVQTNTENVQLTRSDFYNELQHRGHTYSGSYKSLRSLTLGEEGSIGIIEWKEKWTYLVDAMLQQHLFQAGERSQEVHVPKLIQRVALSFPQLPTNKTDVEVAYEYATNIISTDGIQISGTTTVPLEVEDNCHLDAIECVPLSSQFSRIESGIEFAIQLAAANYSELEMKTVFITEIESTHNLGEKIRNVMNESKQLNINFSSVAQTKQIVIHQSQAQLFVYNDAANDQILKLLSTANILLLTRPSKNILSDPQIIQAAEFTTGSDNYVIIRKANTAKVQTINIRGDTLSIKDLKRGSVTWVSELNAAAEEAMQKSQLVYLITSLVPVEGFYNFVQELKSSPNMKCLRIIFNLDKKSVDFTAIIQRNLVVSILKSGTWYSYLPLSCAFKDNIELNNCAVPGIIENNTISYISVNLRDETLNPARPKRNEVGNIDYAGINKNGEEIMGLAYLDKDSTKLVPDTIFSWTLPESWSLEDAVTVPHAYVCAYYMLMVKAGMKHGDTVLIHAGCSPIGLAASSIAHTHGCNVFVTVATDKQRAYLRKNHSYLRDFNILDSESSSFSSQLMLATGGKGAEVILNCVSGSLLQNSLSCIADYGRFIQYGRYDTEEGTNIGMYCFLRNASFYVVNLENVFMQPKDVKEEIRSMIVKGIENFIVRPLHREVVSHYNVANILNTIKDSSNIGKIAIIVNNNFSVNKLNVNKPNKFICSSKSSYFIYGGSSENWADLAEWLVRRGARKIVVVSESKPQQTHINRRLSLLQTFYGASIITAPSRAHTREGAAEVLSEVYTLGPLHAVFTLPSKGTGTRASDTKPVQYLDGALRTMAPKAVLVNFISSAAGICYNRADAGFLTYNVQWQKTSDIADGVSALDSVLSSKVSNVFVKKSRDGEQKTDGGQGGIKDMSKVIPTIEDIIREQKNAPEEPELVQVITEGPLEIRELAPLFIVPGMMGQPELEEMVTHLLYPTFLTAMPATPWPIERLAEVFAQKMQDLYPKGVFNIVSVSSGGPLAIEIARILHKQNASLHLFFVDSAPNRIQQALKELGETSNDQSLNFLRRVFDINDSEVVKKLEATNDWERRIQIPLGGYEGSEQDQKLLTEGLIRIKNQIDSIMAFQPNGDLVSGKIHLILTDDSSRYDSCGLSSYCQQPPKIQLVPGDHLSIIPAEITHEYINRNHYLI
ncbi:unnamed protein product [Phaedon cochleariae]|uniref:Uncharacterized protein n=1 Tax=Phaedon cochleariae TaxID=80249 RepID=A0A9N9SL34_PHACE|nr:unnamed protein product [Phaedon cochleariae]